MNDISKKLKRLRNEDFIWIVYFFIVVFALYSNKLDRDYLLKKDNVSLISSIGTLISLKNIILSIL